MEGINLPHGRLKTLAALELCASVDNVIMWDEVGPYFNFTEACYSLISISFASNSLDRQNRDSAPVDLYTVSYRTRTAVNTCNGNVTETW